MIGVGPKYNNRYPYRRNAEEGWDRQKRRRHGYTEKETEDGGRDGSDAVTGQEMPNIADTYQKLRERNGRAFPSEPPQGNTFILVFWLPELWESTFVLF